MLREGSILITFLPSMLLSNFVFPVSNMPKVLQAFTYVVPARYYIEILSGIYLKNLTFTQLWQDFLVLFIMGVLLAALNLKLLREEGL